jgi:hypothetical protein
MPAPKPLEFHRRAIELARRKDQPVAQIAKDFKPSRVSCRLHVCDIAGWDARFVA